MIKTPKPSQSEDEGFVENDESLITPEERTAPPPIPPFASGVTAPPIKEEIPGNTPLDEPNGDTNE